MPAPAVSSPSIHRIAGRVVKSHEMQATVRAWRIPGNEARLKYAARTKDEASRPWRDGGSRFSTAYSGLWKLV